MDLNITTTILTPNTNVFINDTTVLINGTAYFRHDKAEAPEKEYERLKGCWDRKVEGWKKQEIRSVERRMRKRKREEERRIKRGNGTPQEDLEAEAGKECDTVGIKEVNVVGQDHLGKNKQYTRLAGGNMD